MAAATITGGVTPVYAAPETFDGWLSRFSDQYILAIVYQELLTGVRPFPGSTMRQLVLQHLQSPPDIASLPANDRPPVLRALAKNPDDRFPTCLEFVQALRGGVAQAFPSAPAVPGSVDVRPAPAAPVAPLPDSEPQSAVAVTWNARKVGSLASFDIPDVAPAAPGPSVPEVAALTGAELLSKLTRKTVLGQVGHKPEQSVRI